MDILGRVTLLNNDAIDSTTGLAIAPKATDLAIGQVAVNYSAQDACLFIKDNAGNIIKFTTEAKIAQTLSDILGESAADLNTLKELLTIFAGADNDVLTLIKNIQTELGTKASAATLNNHIGSFNNPHNVKAAQVGALPLAGGTMTGDVEWLQNTGNSSLFPAHIYRRVFDGDGNVYDHYGKPNADVFKNTFANLRVFSDGEHIKVLRFGGDGTFTWDGNDIWHAGNTNNIKSSWIASQLSVNDAVGFNRNATTGAIFDSKKHAFQFTHVGNEDSSKDLLKLEVYKGSGSPRHHTLTILANGNMGVYNSAPTEKLSVGGNISLASGANRYFFVHASGTAGATGNSLIIGAGETKAGTANINGGNLILEAGAGTGSGTSNIIFNTSGGTSGGTTLNGLSERMRIDRLGNVGIGTTAPTEKLTVNGNIALSIGGTRRIGVNSKVDAGLTGDSLIIASGNSMTGAANTNGGTLYLDAGAGTGSGISNIILRTASGTAGGTTLNSKTDRMIVTGNGNVGIGTNNPTAKLQVNGETSIGALAIARASDGSHAFRIESASSTDNTMNVTNNSGGGNIAFLTNYNGTTSEKVRITGIGNVGIGTTSPTSKLAVNGNGIFKVDSTATVPDLGSLYSDKTFCISNAFQSSNNAPNYGLFTGILNTGNVWMQTGRNDGNRASYNLLLQPVGGSVGIGTTSPTAKLDIVGSAATSDIDKPVIRCLTGRSYDSSQYIEIENNATEHGRIGYRLLGKSQVANDIWSTSRGRSRIEFLSKVNDAEEFTSEFSIQHLMHRNRLGIVYNNGTSNGNLALCVKNNGSIGINNENPNAALDVIGDVLITRNTSSELNGSSRMLKFTGNSLQPNSGGAIMWSGESSYNIGRMSFFTHNAQNWDSLAEAMCIKSNGNVGIGTTSPTYKLDVTGDIRANKTFTNNANAAQIHITGADATASNAGDVFTGITFGYAPTGSSAGASIVARHNSGNGTALLFHTTTNWGSLFERMRISQNGNVGIGINNPTYRLHSVDTIKAPSFSGTKIRIECNEEGVSKDRESEINNYQSNLFLQHNSSRNLIMCHGGGSVGIGTLSPTSKFHVVGTSKLIGNTSIGGNLAVEGAINSTGQISTEDEVIASGDIKSTSGGIIAAGEVIAYKAATALQEGTPVGSVVVYDGLDSTSPDVALSANMGRALNADVLATRTLANNAAKTATWSSITGTPDAFTPCEHNHYDSVYPSDRRLKHNIETIERGLNYVLSMNPVSYVWSAEAINKFNLKEPKAYGLIAQELELLLPECTTKIDGDTLGVDYIKIIPFLIAAIKDLDAKLAVTNQKINTMTKAQNRAYSASYTNEKEIELLKEQVAQQSEQINQLMNKLK